MVERDRGKEAVNKRRREKRGLDVGFPRWQKGRNREK